MKAVVITLTLFALSSLPFTLGASYMPGVMVGSWAKYTVSGQSSMMSSMQGMGSMEVQVQSISGNNMSMTITMTKSGMMGSQSTHHGWFDMQKGVGSMDFMDMMEALNTDMDMGMNMTMMSRGMMESGEMNMSFLMAGGLNSGNPIFQGSQITFNQTMTRSYAGTSRDVNQLQITRMYSGHIFTMTGYWDMQTGMMTEFTITQNSSTQSISLQLASTSLWGSLGLFPLGPLITVVTLAGITLIVKRRIIKH